MGRTTPLHCAVFKRDVAMVHFLFERGASAKIRDDFGDTAFDCLPIVFSPDQAESVAEIMQLFVQYSDQSDFVSSYPLHKAASHGNVERVQFLIDQGVDVNAYNDSMHTPLHYAVGRQQYDVVALLLENGADVTLVDNHNKTPLDWALDIGAAGHNKGIIELLKKDEKI